jgi:platelet-activating factor acetylhydrolase IB subunit alpha
MKTLDAHNHFVTTLAWGRQPASGGAVNGTNGDGVAAEPEKLVNVIATGSVDQTIKIWLP